jgi:hypothetical protein
LIKFSSPLNAFDVKINVFLFPLIYTIVSFIAPARQRVSSSVASAPTVRNSFGGPTTSWSFCTGTSLDKNLAASGVSVVLNIYYNIYK